LGLTFVHLAFLDHEEPARLGTHNNFTRSALLCEIEFLWVNHPAPKILRLIFFLFGARNYCIQSAWTDPQVSARSILFHPGTNTDTTWLIT